MINSCELLNATYQLPLNADQLPSTHTRTHTHTAHARYPCALQNSLAHMFSQRLGSVETCQRTDILYCLFFFKRTYTQTQKCSILPVIGSHFFYNYQAVNQFVLCRQQKRTILCKTTNSSPENQIRTNGSKAAKPMLNAYRLT